MANTVKLKRSAVQGNAPSTTDLALGELGLNTYDGKLFMKKDDGTEAIVEIGAGGTELASDTSPQLGGDLDMNSNFISSGILGVKTRGLSQRFASIVNQAMHIMLLSKLLFIATLVAILPLRCLQRMAVQIKSSRLTVAETLVG